MSTEFSEFAAGGYMERIYSAQQHYGHTQSCPKRACPSAMSDCLCVNTALPFLQTAAFD